MFICHGEQNNRSQLWIVSSKLGGKFRDAFYTKHTFYRHVLSTYAE